MRRVRNAFAHSSADMGLADPAHKSRLADAYTETTSGGPSTTPNDKGPGHFACSLRL